MPDSQDYQFDVPIISPSGKTITHTLWDANDNLITQLKHINNKKLKLRAFKNRMIPTYEKGY